MNNEISLRTSKGEYLPGHTVYGAVYLNILRPTEASGITISFKGLETCTYEYDCDGKKRLNDCTVHVDFSDVPLYSQADCFNFGSYVFPFQFDLPKDIPGTFHCLSHSNKTSWQASVTYVLQAKAAGADGLQIYGCRYIPFCGLEMYDCRHMVSGSERYMVADIWYLGVQRGMTADNAGPWFGNIKSCQHIVVYQVEEQALRDNQCGLACSVSYDLPRFFLRSQKIHVTARLIENLKHSGSNMQLRLIVTNPTKLRLASFRILLLRSLKLYVRDKIAEKTLDNMEYSGDVIHIAPESGPHVVYSKEGDLSSFFLDCLELDQLQIPLKERMLGEDYETNIPPSVAGKHVKNQYQLEITLAFENKHKEMIYLSIPGVLPEENQQWLQWKPSEWTFKAETKLSRSLFSVHESALRTDAFSGLPTFHVL